MAKGHWKIGILFESNEWSDCKLASEIADHASNKGIDADVELIDMESPESISQALKCDFLVSRVFASAVFRGHSASHERMEELASLASDAGIPAVNPWMAHRYEVDKHASTTALANAGVTVPRIQAIGTPAQIDSASLAFPCVIKPNCGGRTTLTTILRDREDALAFLEAAPDHAFIVEDYIFPEEGFLTRIEIVGGKVASIVKRSIADNGLSGYHEGSSYSPYPNPSEELLDDAICAAEVLGFSLGSFDVIESGGKRYFIDANSVSNVSEDCTELLGCDLMAMHAKNIVDNLEKLIDGHVVGKEG